MSSLTQPILSEYAGLASSVPSCLSSLTSDIQTSQQFKDPFPYCYVLIRSPRWIFFLSFDGFCDDRLLYSAQFAVLLTAVPLSVHR